MKYPKEQVGNKIYCLFPSSSATVLGMVEELLLSSILFIVSKMILSYVSFIGSHIGMLQSVLLFV